MTTTEYFQEKELLFTEIGAKVSDTTFIRNIYIHYDDTDVLDNFKKKYHNRSLHKGAWMNNDINHPDKSLMYGDFYMDFDSREDFRYVKEDVIKTISLFKVLFNISSDDINIFFSGKKGIHIIIPASIFDVTPHNNLDVIYKQLAMHIKDFTSNKTIDTQIYHKRAMLRMANTIHEGSGLYKTRISMDELVHKTKEEISDISSSIRSINWKSNVKQNEDAKKIFTQYVTKGENILRSKNNTKYEQKLDHDPECIKYLLSNVTVQGTRNLVLSILSCHFRARGYEYSLALDKLIAWNNAYCSPKVSNIEIIQVLRSTYNGNKRYGCSTLSKLNGCNSSECKLCSKKGANDC